MEPIVLQRVFDTAAPEAASKARGNADAIFIVPAGLDHQADFSPGAARAAAPVRHRTRSHRGRRRLVGRRPVHRQSRLEQASGLRAGEALRGRAAIPRRPGRRALRHARRLEDQLAVARSAARSLGLSEVAQILRDDHSEAIWRAWFLGLCAFGSDPQTVDALDLRRRAPPWCRTRSARANCCCNSAPRRSRITGCRGWRAARKFPASA